MDSGAWAKGVAPLKLIAFGDSLTAGYGLAASAAFPSVLEKRLREEGDNLTIVNAGVSGDTASDGLARIDWTLQDGADGVIVELGANDMLRGIDPSVTRVALDAICAKIVARKIKILIAGMHATPSLGTEYKVRFDAIYPELARKYQAPLYPFFLDGVAGQPSLLLEDHLHPNAEGILRIVEGIRPLVHSFLQTMNAETRAKPEERK